MASDARSTGYIRRHSLSPTLKCLFCACAMPDRDPEGAPPRLVLYMYLKNLDEPEMHRQVAQIKQEHG